MHYPAYQQPKVLEINGTSPSNFRGKMIFTLKFYTQTFSQYEEKIRTSSFKDTEFLLNPYIKVTSLQVT